MAAAAGLPTHQRPISQAAAVLGKPPRERRAWHATPKATPVRPTLIPPPHLPEKGDPVYDNCAFLVDKPLTFTSHDVCAKLKPTLNARKIGHAGTLDVLASGAPPALRSPRLFSHSSQPREALPVHRWLRSSTRQHRRPLCLPVPRSTTPSPRTTLRARAFYQLRLARAQPAPWVPRAAQSPRPTHPATATHNGARANSGLASKTRGTAPPRRADVARRPAGLLVVCVGKGTKSAEHFMGQQKQYSGSFKLGEATASYDAETDVVQTAAWEHITDEELQSVATGEFTGELQQVRPAQAVVFVVWRVGGARRPRRAHLAAAEAALHCRATWRGPRAPSRMAATSCLKEESFSVHRPRPACEAPRALGCRVRRCRPFSPRSK